MMLALMNSLDQHNQNEVQHDFFGHMMPLAQVLEVNQNWVQHDFLVM